MLLDTTLCTNQRWNSRKMRSTGTVISEANATMELESLAARIMNDLAAESRCSGVDIRMERTRLYDGYDVPLDFHRAATGQC
jgi:hypothetical protein